MEPIVVEQRFGQEEFVRLAMRIWVSAFTRSKVLVFYGTILLTLLLIGIVWRGGADLFGLGMIAVAVLVFVAVVWWRVKVSFQKQYTDNFRFQETIRYEFTEEKMVSRGESFMMETPWTRISRSELWQDYYLLFAAQTRASAISRSAFTPDMEQQFQQLLDRVKPGWRK